MARRSDITVWIKGQSKEKLLIEVIKAYEACYPQKFAYYRSALRQLREVTVGRHEDMKGRTVDINMRVPTEPFLFLQTLIPDFGKDSNDIRLLCKVWEDFAIAKSRDKSLKRSILWTKDLHKESPAADARVQPQDGDCPADVPDDSCLSDNDRQGLCNDAEGHPLVDQPELPA